MKFLKSALVVLGLLLLYTLLQGGFAFLAYVVAGVVACMDGTINVSLSDLGSKISFEEFQNMLVASDYGVWAIASALFFSALVMLFIIFLSGLVKVRKTTFTAIKGKVLFVAVALVFFSMLFLNNLVQFVDIYYPIPDLMEDTFESLSHNPLGILSMTLLAPILEEVMFRGAIQGYLMRNYKNPYVGILVASLVFGVFHLNPIQVIYASLLGFILGWIYYRTGSLLPVVIGHVLNNSLACLSLLFFSGAEEEIYSQQNNIMILQSTIVFALITLWLIIKLNRCTPPVHKPWSELGEQVAEPDIL